MFLILRISAVTPQPALQSVHEELQEDEGVNDSGTMNALTGCSPTVAELMAHGFLLLFW